MAKGKASRQKKKPHGKRKNLTAERKKPHGKEKKSYSFCCEVFSFAVTVVGHRAFLMLP